MDGSIAQCFHTTLSSHTIADLLTERVKSVHLMTSSPSRNVGQQLVGVESAPSSSSVAAAALLYRVDS